jgi:signal peptidase II
VLQEEPASQLSRVSVSGREVLCYFLLAALAVAAVAADLFTKRWALVHAPQDQVLFRNLLSMSLTTNSGASFGILVGKAHWLAAAGVLILVAVLVFWWSEGRKSLWLSAAIGLLCGGAVGNLRDRIHLGWVVDFLRFDLPGLRWWPAFNVADVAAVAGVLMTVIWLTWPRGSRTPREAA